MWAVVIAASRFVTPVLRIEVGNELLAIIGFYAFATVSVLWSDLSSASLLKGLAMAITTFGAYRLARSMPLGQIIDCTLFGFFLVASASMFLVLFVPSIGVDQSWMHAGDWQGVFESKQALGTVGAFLLFFAFNRVLNRGGRWSFAVLFVLALSCVIGSGSRGGGALAVAACASVYVSRRSVLWTKLLAFGPLLMIFVAIPFISYLYVTGHEFIPMFGVEVDFTERAIIWQYALHHFGDAPILGYGLNGFWSIAEVYHDFEREHGWVLDNYHDGYLAILIETGILGMALFSLNQFLFGVKMWWLTSTKGMVQADYSAIVGFANLVFLIDFTETFFLRSTNINAVLLVTLQFIACRGPQAADPPKPRRNGTPPVFA